WIEVSVVCAALLGTVTGGLLVSDWLRGSSASALAQGLLAVGGGASSLSFSMFVLLAIYGLSTLLNLGVPESGARYAASRIHPAELTRDFLRANRLLWRDA